MSILSKIQNPQDVKKLDASELPELAREIRNEIIDVTSQRVTETLMASLILAGKDEYGIGYIEHIRARDERRS